MPICLPTACAGSSSPHADIEKPHFAQAAAQGMMMVNYDSRMPTGAESGGLALDSVSMDNIEAGRMAAEHLIARGCRRLIFTTVAGMTSSRAHKIEGFLSAVRRHGLYYDGMIVEEQTMVAYGDTEMTELGRSLAKKICQQSQRPDGVVAINDALGIGLMAGLHEAGYSVPGEISIIGIDNIPLSGLVYPGLTSIMPPLAEMAEVMVERLIERIENPTLSPAEFLFPPALVRRQSVRGGARVLKQGAFRCDKREAPGALLFFHTSVGPTVSRILAKRRVSPDAMANSVSDDFACA
nr:LacI family transcriptional regulator [Raoultella sp. NCTC 9187]